MVVPGGGLSAFWDNWFGKKKEVKPGPYDNKAKGGVKAAKPKPKQEEKTITAGRHKGKTNIEKRFKLLNRLGQGSMSKVWRATDNESGKTVVVKVLDQDKLMLFESVSSEMKPRKAKSPFNSTIRTS